MRLLLDTVTFLWSLESPDKISRAALSALRSDGAVREISVISLSEIATKRNAGKLAIEEHDVAQGIEDLEVRILSYTTEHAWALFDLPLHHRDPFDRQIIAQAMAEQIPVVTADRMFRLYKDLEVIW